MASTQGSAGVSTMAQLKEIPESMVKCEVKGQEVIVPLDDFGSGSGQAKVQYVTEPPPAGTDPQVISILLEA